jgi:hypothetical protein
LSKLELKIQELENRINFYKKYEKKTNPMDDQFIEHSIKNLDNIILNLDKNIISKGQFNRNNKNIEFEF